MNENPVTIIGNTEQKVDYPLIPVNPLDLPSEIFASALNRRLENRKMILKAIKANLKSGIDYGSIPLKRGTASKTKPVLFKSGAERIISLLGLTAHFPSYHEYEKAAINGFNIEVVILRCELLDSQGRRVSEALAARRLNQDFGDLNRTVKMCTKSGTISALLALGFSEIFTVDLEDMTDATPFEASSMNHQAKAITQEQLEQLNSLISNLGLDQKRVESYCMKLVSAKGLKVIHNLEELPAELFDFVANKLPDLAEKSKAQPEAA
jgi:hypothetical protein